MGGIEFRDWLPSLVAALLSAGLVALLGWWANACVQRKERIARVQMERKRDIYQPLHREVVESRLSLEKQPFPRPSDLSDLSWDPNRGPTYVHPSTPEFPGQAQEYPAFDAPTCSVWIDLKRQGRDAEVSADIVQAFTRILQARDAYVCSAGADLAKVQSTARALSEAFASAETALANKIGQITKKYEGG
jgi:hypothetical protein